MYHARNKAGLTDIPSSRPWLLDFPVPRSPWGFGRVLFSITIMGDLGPSRKNLPSSPPGLGASWTELNEHNYKNRICYFLSFVLITVCSWGMSMGMCGHGPFITSYSVLSNAIVLSHGLCLGYSVLWSFL